MDSFMEHMIKRKKSKSTIVKSILIIVGATALSLVLTALFIILSFIFGPVVFSLWSLAVAGMVYLAYRIIASFDVEYEYILTNGELDVDKITNRKRRKRLITIHSKSFTDFGKVSDGRFPSESDKDFARVIDASSHSDIYEDYYAVFFKNGQRIKLIFNPTQKMIDAFKVFAPRVVS